jgi:hypothetical protein
MVSAVERDEALKIGLKHKDWKNIFAGKSGMNEVYYQIITHTPDEVYRRVITRMVAATVDESNFVLTEDGDTGALMYDQLCEYLLNALAARNGDYDSSIEGLDAYAAAIAESMREIGNGVGLRDLAWYMYARTDDETRHWIYEELVKRIGISVVLTLILDLYKGYKIGETRHGDDRIFRLAMHASQSEKARIAERLEKEIESTITIVRKESNYNDFRSTLIFDMQQIYNIFTPEKISEVLEIKDFRAMIRAM